MAKSTKPLDLTEDERLILQGLCEPYGVSAVVRNRNCVRLTSPLGKIGTDVHGRPLTVEQVDAALSYLKAEALRNS